MSAEAPPPSPRGDSRAAPARAPRRRRTDATEALETARANIITRALRVGYLPYALPWPARQLPDQDGGDVSSVDSRAFGICERDYSNASPATQVRAAKLIGRFLCDASEPIRRAIGEALLDPVRANARDLTDFLDRFDSEASGTCCTGKHAERDPDTGACKRCDVAHVNNVVAGILWLPHLSEEGELLEQPRDLTKIPLLSRAGNPSTWLDARERNAGKELCILERVQSPLPRGPPAPGGRPLPCPPEIPLLR
eukprot:gene6142-14987_t